METPLFRGGLWGGIAFERYGVRRRLIWAWGVSLGMGYLIGHGVSRFLWGVSFRVKVGHCGDVRGGVLGRSDFRSCELNHLKWPVCENDACAHVRQAVVMHGRCSGR